MSIGIKVGSKEGKGGGSRIFTTLFMLPFFAAGLFFGWLVINTAFHQWGTWTWMPAPAQILESRMESGDDYEFKVAYRYEWHGIVHDGAIYRVGYSGSDDVAKVEELKRRYPVGKDVQCLVNPGNPAESALEKSSPWITVFVILPLIFLIISTSVIWFAWFPGKKSAEAESTNGGSLVKTVRKGGGEKIVRWIAILFGLIGLVWVGCFTVPFGWEWLASGHWPEVPCVVERSRVQSHDSDDGTTYSVDILYRYEFGGQTYRSNRYLLMGGSSSGRESKARVVRGHPVGKRTVCYVNPDKPSQAVLNRSFHPIFLIHAIPMVFLGVACLIWMGGGTSKRSAVSGATVREDPVHGGAIELKPKNSPMAKVLGSVLMALFWNGIISVFLSEVFEGFRKGEPEWVLTLFMIPFVAVGILLVGAAGYFIAAYFNPRPRLALVPETPFPGGELRVAWQIRGQAGRLSNLKMELRGMELVEYTSGSGKNKSQVRLKSVFCRLPLVETSDPREIRTGTAMVALPADAVPSFEEARGGKILWVVDLHGTIRRWPDLDEEFPFTVGIGQ